MNAFSLSPNTVYMNAGNAWLASNPGTTLADWYRQHRRIVTFDTSAHNRIVKVDIADADPIYSAFASRFFFRLAGLSYEELVATQVAAYREPLINGCWKLAATPIATGWDCVHTFYEMLRVLIVAHSSDPANFQWRSVEVRSGGLADAIVTGYMPDDEMAKAQWAMQEAVLERDKSMWRNLRAKLDPMFGGQGLPRPTTFAQALQTSAVLFAGIGKDLYDAGLRFDAELKGESRTFDTPPDTVQHFADNCPPFRAVMLGMLVSWYNDSLRDFGTGEKLSAGRNDLYMAIYLPLCDIFVTRDAGQAKCLRELRKHIGAPAGEVMLFDEFAGLCA